jgi:uncharacterized membrane protein YfcA
MHFTILLAGAFFAGSVDAMVGGGGLVQLPLLFAAYPHQAPARLLGTSKLAGVFGTSSAAWRFSRRVILPWNLLIPGLGLAFTMSLCGAITATHVPSDVFRPLVPVMLSVVLIYTLLRKDFGQVHAPRDLHRQHRIAAFMMIAAIGAYDGFFGPGTGSFFMVLFIRFFGFDFLNAAASARMLNVATNLSALLWFGAHGSVLWSLGLAMAVCNVAGAQVGTRLALRGGTQLMRYVFIVIVAMLIMKTGHDAWLLLQGSR